MDFESRRQRILDKMEDNSIAILYSGIEHHVSADEYDLFTAQANRNFFYLTPTSRGTATERRTRRSAAFPSVLRAKALLQSGTARRILTLNPSRAACPTR